FGDGEIALRLPSALAGIATVAVAWGIGRELAGARAAAACAALVAVNPLFVWYSQEARVYALFVLLSALAMLCFLRARAQPTRGRMAAFALCGSLALLTHYFSVFLLVPMVLVLVADPAVRRAALPAAGACCLAPVAAANVRSRSSPSPSRPAPSRDAGAGAGVAQAAQLALLLAGFGVLAPIVLAALGADYLAPRNLVAAMIPVSALIAVSFAASVS